MKKRLKSATAPETSDSFYKLLMEIKEQNHQSQLAFQKQNFELQLKIAEMEFGDDSEEMQWINLLKPYLPQLLNMVSGSHGGEEKPIYMITESGKKIENLYKEKVVNNDANIALQSQAEGSFSQPSAPSDMKEKTQETIKAIQEGKMSFEEAWKQYDEIERNLLPPPYDALNREKFQKLYGAIKAGKLKI